MRAQERERSRVARVLDRDGVARVDERARDEVEPLLRAVHDEKRVGIGGDAAAREALGERLAERPVAERRAVREERAVARDLREKRRERGGRESPARRARGARGRTGRDGLGAPAARRDDARRSSDDAMRSHAGAGPRTGAALERRATRVPPPLFVSIQPSRLRIWRAWWTVARFTSSARARSREAGRRSPSRCRPRRMSRMIASAIVRYSGTRVAGVVGSAAVVAMPHSRAWPRPTSNFAPWVPNQGRGRTGRPYSPRERSAA